jgi:SAM-dependent methyltransferase
VSAGGYQVWVDFFDDAYRDIYSELLHPARTEHEVAAVVRLLRLSEGERVLDLCCGDGRHAVPLQRRGLRVTGVDLSAAMVRSARARGLRVLADDDPQPLWIRADCGKLPLRASFDAALLLYNSISFGSREMTQALFESARSALGAGGRMLIECTHREHEARAALGERATQELSTPLGPVLIERRFDPRLGEQHAKMTFRDRAGAPQEKHLRYLTYSAGELQRMLELAGFARIELFGGYDQRAFSADTPAVLRASV